MPSLQSFTSERTRRRASGTVSITLFESGSRSSRIIAAFKNPTSNLALWATITLSPMKSRRVPSKASIRGAGITMASVIPVRMVMKGGMPQPGFTRVWKVPMHSPPRYLAAPISVIRSCSAEPPVVSKSMTQKVTSLRGIPISSKVFCTI